MIRKGVRWLWMAMGWLELGVLTLPLYLLSYLPAARGSAWYRRGFRLWCNAFVDALGVELRLHQKNRRPLPERFLLIANHPSAFEDIGIPALFDVDSLAKAEVRHWWIVGRISAAAGTLFVHRESRESRADAGEAIAARLAAGRNVALYPEGGVFDRRIHDSFRYGAFDISLRTGIPIVPVFIHYEAQEDFFWGDEPLPRKILQLMGTVNNRANYYLYDAFDPAGFDDKAEYSEFVRQRYLEWQARYLD